MRKARWMAWGLTMILLGTGPGFGQADYGAEFARWHQHRIENLKQPDSWLSLAGLFWLEPGANSFGSADSNAVVFPKGPARMGSYQLAADGTIEVTVDPAVDIRRDGTPVRRLTLSPHDKEGSTVLTMGSLSWYVIKRDDRWGIRLKDRESAALLNFKGIETYPPEQRWRVPGRFEAYPPGRRIAVPNILGTISQEECPGALVFSVKGHEYRLDAVHEEGESRFFVIFADATSGNGSYGPGRFLYVDPPGPDGRVVLDFNHAYNPPCAFSNFATCPRPPKQNVLTLAVEAGERNFEHP